MSNIQFIGRLAKRHPIHRGYYWNVQFPRLDIMHTLDHHGQSSIIIASTVHHVISQSDALARLWRCGYVRLELINSKLKRFNEDHPSSAYVNKIQMSNLCLGKASESWLELHGPTIKSAITRHMVPAIRSICDEYLNDGPLDRCIAVILCEQCHLYDVIHDAGMFLREQQLAELQECVFTLGEHLQLARRLSGSSGTLAWQIKPKVR